MFLSYIFFFLRHFYKASPFVIYAFLQEILKSSKWNWQGIGMEDKELNLVDHLDELRNRLIISVVAFIVFFGVGFYFVEDIYHYFVRDLDVKLIVLGPSDIIWIYFMLATIIAIAGTIPVLALQIWLFVKPALMPNERKISLSYIPALFILFVVGLAFGYFVIFPNVLNFLSSLCF